MWLTLQVECADKMTRAVQRNVRQARRLAARVEATPDLELIAPVGLNVVCLRHASPDVPPERVDALNRDVLVRLQEGGLAAPSATRARGRSGLRAATMNHRTRDEDVDGVVEDVLSVGGDARCATA